MIRVLLALRDQLTALGLQAALDRAEGFEVVGVAHTLEDAKSLVKSLNPDVMVLGKQLEQVEPDAMCTLREHFPQLKVLVYVPHGQDECVLRSAVTSDAQVFPRKALQEIDCCLVSLQACARGCVPRDATPEQLANSIRAVVAGEIAAGPWISSHFEAKDSERGSITHKEIEILRFVAQGLSNKAIARRLDVREQTVKNHLFRIARKLGRRTRLELALFAIQNHVADVSTES